MSGGVLAMIDRAIMRARERGASKGSPSDHELRAVRRAVAELIEADTELDAAREACATFGGAILPLALTGRLHAAQLRRAAALEGCRTVTP